MQGLTYMMSCLVSPVSPLLTGLRPSGHWQSLQPPPSLSTFSPVLRSLPSLSHSLSWVMVLKQTRSYYLFICKLSIFISITKCWSSDNVSVMLQVIFRWRRVPLFLYFGRSSVTGSRGGRPWESWNQNHVTKERLLVCDWPDWRHPDLWLVGLCQESIIMTVEWQLSPPGQDQNKVLASGRSAAKIIAIPLSLLFCAILLSS